MNDIFRKKTQYVNEETKHLITKVKEKAEELYGDIVSCGESREISIAKTKLEEAVMWTVKHLTRKDD
jgi:ribosomal protein S17